MEELKVRYPNWIRIQAVFEFAQSLGKRITNLSENLYFTVFWAKMVPLKKGSIAKSTTSRKTFCKCPNLNHADLKLGKMSTTPILMQVR